MRAVKITNILAETPKSGVQSITNDYVFVAHNKPLPVAAVLDVIGCCGVVGCGVTGCGVLNWALFLEALFVEDRLSSAMKLLGVGNPFPEGTGELLQLQLFTKFGKEDILIFVINKLPLFFNAIILIDGL